MTEGGKRARITFQARRETVRDDLNRRRMAFKIRDVLPGDPVLDMELWTFLRLVNVTAVSGLSFALPTADSDAADIMSAFESYLALPATTAERWKKAVAAANETLNEAADPNG